MSEVGANEPLLFFKSWIPGYVAPPGTVLVMVIIAPFRLLMLIYLLFEAHMRCCWTYEVIGKLYSSHIGRRILEINNYKLLMFIGRKQ